MTKNEIINKLIRLSAEDCLKNYRLGLAGSMARGTNSRISDVDIVVDTDDMPLEVIEFIKDNVSDGFSHIDVLCLGLLRREDKELDHFLKEAGLPENDESVYKTICKDVIWVGRT